jgi:hypothetical protein
MKIAFTWRPLLVFGSLLFVLGEAHELVHTGLGRLLFLATNSLLGAPLLLTCWMAAVGAVLALTQRYLFALGQPVSAAALGAPLATFTR